MKVFYFTATGNSLDVAKRVGGEPITLRELGISMIHSVNTDYAG